MLTDLSGKKIYSRKKTKKKNKAIKPFNLLISISLPVNKFFLFYLFSFYRLPRLYTSSIFFHYSILLSLQPQRTVSLCFSSVTLNFSICLILSLFFFPIFIPFTILNSSKEKDLVPVKLTKSYGYSVIYWSLGFRPGKFSTVKQPSIATLASYRIH